MSEQTLLIIFIGLVALSLAGIAAIGISVGWQIYKILAEVRIILGKAHMLGDEAIADYHVVREHVHAEGQKVRNIFGFILGFIERKLRMPRRKSKVDSE